MELMRYREEEYWSSGEDESKEEESNSISIGRGYHYECVYCKRGFTTAQALGGHMNIHRKDRPKSKPKPSNITSTSTSTSTNYHLGLSLYYNSPIIHPPPPYFSPPPSATHQDHQVVDVDLDYSNTNTNNHQFYYYNPAPTCTPPSSSSFYSNNNHPFCVPLPPIPHNSQHHALDLELRLGYHP